MNKTEILISNFYHSINILDVSLFTIETITERLSIKLCYWSHSSAIASYGDMCCVFINESLSKCGQWQNFGHEMYHYLHDETSYDLLNESYAEYGETKADYFAYHFCVPTFMLQQLKEVSVYDVMELFNVEFDFAMRRLEMYMNKCITKGEFPCDVNI